MDNKLNLVPVEYIGGKRQKTDTVTGSGIVWNGCGDVQHVPVPVAQRLLVPAYADIWRMGPTEPPPPALPPSTGGASTSSSNPAAELPLVVSAIAELLGSEDAGAMIDESGLPRLEALSAKLGRPVTPQERDAAWAEVLKAADTPV